MEYAASKRERGKKVLMGNGRRETVYDEEELIVVKRKVLTRERRH